LVKTAENTYRDVQIAFANELALICEEYGADVYEVRELVNKSPNRSMHLPGAGVGGHCIPKDPWLLVAAMPDAKPTRLISTARAINASMPHHLVEKLVAMLDEQHKNIRGAKVAVLGLAYLENSDDTRNSPSDDLIEELNKLGAVAVINDPYVDGVKNNIYDLVTDCDAIVVMVAHDDYRKLDWNLIRSKVRTPILLDGRHLLQREQVVQAGFNFYCIGVGD
jgi:UDP-N-acetyl-D-mannosaminuronic acid dehydrogenase